MADNGKETRKRMNQGRFMKIWIPIISVLFVLCLVVTIVLNNMTQTMDSFFGKGERHIVNAENTQTWDLEYYDVKETDSRKSEANAEEVARKVADEGSILLKNNGALPLAAGREVTPFGYGYLNPQYSNITSEYNNATQVTPASALAEKFTVNNAAVDKMNAATRVVIGPAEGTLDGTVNALETDINLYEYDPAIYAGIESEAEGTVGIVFVTRKLGEGFDQKYDGYEDGTPHSLALTSYEKETIAFSKAHCDSTVVVLNTGNVMEVTPLMSGEYEADAVLWVGLPGSVGFSALGDLLSGAVNPSGKTADIWASDFTADLTYVNFGEFEYSNVTFMPQGYEAMVGMVPSEMTHKFVNYDEGVYYGYRYYETAAELDDGFVYGTLDGKGGVTAAGAVAYPFGYGLSYSTFDRKITAYDDSGSDISVTVSVENTSDVPGKDVVQIYYTPPYDSSFDGTYKIEKPAVTLAAFAKTDTIAAHGSDEITLTFPKEEMASYCYTHDNGNGTEGCYVLTAGEYTISLRSDSHTVIDERTWNNASTFWYDGSDDTHIRESEKLAQSQLDDEGNSLGFPAGATVDNDVKYTPAVNRFDESSDYMNRDTRLLSRTDWKGTFPSAESRSVAASDAIADDLNAMFSFDPETDPELGNVSTSRIYASEQPESGKDNGLSFVDMRGLDYHDDAWNDLLDQIDYAADQAQIESLLYNTNYATTALDSLGMPATVAFDGPNGFRPKSTGGYAAVYPCAPIVASTWNVALVRELGEAYGQEALTIGADVLYGIGINLHRSPFGGRNGEYYSEDPLLSGKVAAAFVSGAGDQGLICHIKHFALNDQETNRQFYLHTWADDARDIFPSLRDLRQGCHDDDTIHLRRKRHREHQDHARRHRGHGIAELHRFGHQLRQLCAQYRAAARRMGLPRHRHHGYVHLHVRDRTEQQDLAERLRRARGQRPVSHHGDGYARHQLRRGGLRQRDGAHRDTHRPSQLGVYDGQLRRHQRRGARSYVLLRHVAVGGDTARREYRHICVRARDGSAYRTPRHGQQKASGQIQAGQKTQRRVGIKKQNKDRTAA